MSRMASHKLTCEQGSELPEVTDLLRPFARTDTITSAIASPSTSTDSYSIYATNFDGQPVELKRKLKKTSTASSVWLFLHFDMTHANTFLAPRRKLYHGPK